MFSKSITALSRGLTLNLLAALPAIPSMRNNLHLPRAEWWSTTQHHNPILTTSIECIAALALIDLSMTLIHIWWHGKLSQLHATRVHHTIPESEVNWTTGMKFGPWEPLMGVPTVWANIVIFGIPFIPALFATITMLAFSLWSHTNWHPSWYKHLETILITPVSHRVHHSADPALYSRNCAFVFNWDRILGTWHNPRKQIAP